MCGVDSVPLCEDLQGRTENMAQSSRVFVDQTHELRGRHQRKNMRIMICVAVVILLIMAFFLCWHFVPQVPSIPSMA